MDGGQHSFSRALDTDVTAVAVQRAQARAASDCSKQRERSIIAQVTFRDIQRLQFRVGSNQRGQCGADGRRCDSVDSIPAQIELAQRRVARAGGDNGQTVFQRVEESHFRQLQLDQPRRSQRGAEGRHASAFEQRIITTVDDELRE